MTTPTFNISVLKGDGIGIDVTASAIAVLQAATKRVGGFELVYDYLKAGAAYYEETGVDIDPKSERSMALADAIFIGAIGLPHVRYPDNTEISLHLRIRENLQLYAGVRPVKAYPNTPQRLIHTDARKIDLVVLRESSEGLFYTAAVHNRNEVYNDNEVRETLRITRPTTEKLHDFAFRLATKRKQMGGQGLVTCVDKANVFRSIALFRKIFDERAQNNPKIKTSYRYIDALALDLIRCPWEFDVLVMENIFGDIISDLAGGLVGGMGIASCAEIGDNHGLFQPAHGSAPDIQGQNRANPLAAILSGALMLDYLEERSQVTALGDAAKLIESAVDRGFDQARIRPDEFGGDQGTIAVTNTVIELLHEA
ncbi:MAG: isocitrate/isopropylmalate dehydrogenase family protein [Gammaproteobacteria bacterium]|nr:isocitrate/isopropylmalate dehydrogenase family protein [Gammaproteobacteria bacterium]